MKTITIIEETTPFGEKEFKALLECAPPNAGHCVRDEIHTEPHPTGKGSGDWADY